MNDTARQVLFGFGGIAAGVVIVLGCYWLWYGVIERRRERRRHRAMLDAVAARLPVLDLTFDPASTPDATPFSPDALARIAALPDFTMHFEGRMFADDEPA